MLSRNKPPPMLPLFAFARQNVLPFGPAFAADRSPAASLTKITDFRNGEFSRRSARVLPECPEKTELIAKFRLFNDCRQGSICSHQQSLGFSVPSSVSSFLYAVPDSRLRAARFFETARSLQAVIRHQSICFSSVSGSVINSNAPKPFCNTGPSQNVHCAGELPVI